MPVTRLCRPWSVALAALLVSACATPVGVTQLDEQAAHRKLTTSILSADQPSAYSTQVLERGGFTERYQETPEIVLAELNAGLGKPAGECAYSRLRRSRGQPWLLSMP
jgi:hypothetical protein